MNRLTSRKQKTFRYASSHMTLSDKPFMGSVTEPAVHKIALRCVKYYSVKTLFKRMR